MIGEIYKETLLWLKGKVEVIHTQAKKTRKSPCRLGFCCLTKIVVSRLDWTNTLELKFYNNFSFSKWLKLEVSQAVDQVVRAQFAWYRFAWFYPVPTDQISVSPRMLHVANIISFAREGLTFKITTQMIRIKFRSLFMGGGGGVKEPVDPLGLEPLTPGPLIPTATSPRLGGMPWAE